MNRKRFLFINVALLAVAVCLCWSCYKITLVVQAHSIVKGNVFNGKMVIKDTNNTSGGVEHVYGLFGIRVPEGWEVDGQIVMTQVAKATTDTGDPDYNQTITRSLQSSQAYTDLLNRCYPRAGYTWLGFVTSSDFKTLLSGNDATKRVDSIYVNYTIATSSDKTGVYYLDYVAGHIAHDKVNQIGVADRDWATRVATFQADSISNFYLTDTSIRVTNADGSMDGPGDMEWATPVEWDLEPMPNATYAGTARAYKDLKYNELFTRTLGWNGGDGVLTVGLPNGDVLWTFNDSFYGVVNERLRARGSCSFPRNTIPNPHFNFNIKKSFNSYIFIQKLKHLIYFSANNQYINLNN